MMNLKIHKRVYSLNTLGSYVYLCLSDGLTEEQISHSIADQFPIPFKSAERDVKQINQEIQLITQMPINSFQEEISTEIEFAQWNQSQFQSQTIYLLLGWALEYSSVF